MIGNRNVVVYVAKYLNNVGRLCRHNCLFCMECMDPGISDGELPSIQMIKDAFLRSWKCRACLQTISIIKEQSENR